MRKILFFCFFFLLFNPVFSQFNISGKIYDNDSLANMCVSVYLNNGKGTVSDKNGQYIIHDVPAGNYELFCKMIGCKAFQKTLNITGNIILNIKLEQDVFSLSEVKVTGTLSSLSGMQSSHGITTILPDLLQFKSNPVAGQSLSSVPGLYVDYTSGDGGNTVYSRGLNPNTGNSISYIGYKYIALLEDGMPVMGSQIGMLWPDMFIRQNLSVSKIEINRSGASAISVSNMPGGAINYISKQGTEKTNIAAEVHNGYYSNGNLFCKTDVNFSGIISKSPVRYNVNANYRYDQGPKDLSFMNAKGGLVKANFSLPYKKGQTTLFIKALNDHSIYFSRTPFSDIENSKSFPGFNPLYTSLYVDINGDIPDSRRLSADPGARRQPNGSDGIHLQNYYAMINSRYNLFDSLYINVSAKYSILKQRYIESFSNIIIPADKGPALIYNLPTQGGAINFNSFTYTDIKTGEVLAKYLNGTEQFNTMGSDIHIGSLLDFISDVNDIIAKGEFEYNKKNHHIIIGGDFSHTQVENIWNADLTAETFEARPRLSHENRGCILRYQREHIPLQRRPICLRRTSR
ncbi:MAG: TonB-dependent receptor [Bacteroidetes bacterium]|nr:TonB-dependent receptor [Bacteroidota bacterium]